MIVVENYSYSRGLLDVFEVRSAISVHCSTAIAIFIFPGDLKCSLPVVVNGSFFVTLFVFWKILSSDPAGIIFTLKSFV